MAAIFPNHPMSLKDWYFGRDNIICTTIVDVEGRDICAVFNTNEEWGMGNKRLILLAPKLLKECKALINLFEGKILDDCTIENCLNAAKKVVEQIEGV